MQEGEQEAEGGGGLRRGAATTRGPACVRFISFYFMCQIRELVLNSLSYLSYLSLLFIKIH